MDVDANESGTFPTGETKTEAAGIRLRMPSALLPAVDNASVSAVKLAIGNYYKQFAHQVHVCMVVYCFYVATSLASTVMWGALFAILLNLTLHFARICITMTGLDEKMNALIEPFSPATVPHIETQEESLVLDYSKQSGNFVTRNIYRSWWGLYFASQVLRTFVTGGKYPHPTYPVYRGPYDSNMRPKKTM